MKKEAANRMNFRHRERGGAGFGNLGDFATVAATAMAIAMDTPTVPLTYVSLLRLALPSNKKKQEMKEVEKEKKESSFEDFYCDGG